MSLPPDDWKPPRVTFLTGTNYCGSTLVSFVFNSHPEVLSIGEMGPAPRFERPGFPCSCGAPVIECEFFGRIADELRKRGVGFQLGHMGLRFRYSEAKSIERIAHAALPAPFAVARDTIRDCFPPFRSRIREMRERTTAFIGAALDVTGKRVFLDATKTPERIPVLASSDLDLSALHLVRDPRGYCHSAVRNAGMSVDHAAWRWVHVQRRVEHNRRYVDQNRWRRISYEELSTDPDPVLSASAEFVGVGPFPSVSDYKTVPHHIIGNSMRLNSMSIRIQHDESWKDHLTAADRKVISDITGPIARRYGYDI